MSILVICLIGIFFLVSPTGVSAEEGANIPILKQECNPKTGRRSPLPRPQIYSNHGESVMKELLASRYTDKKVEVTPKGDVHVTVSAIPLNEKCNPIRASTVEYCDPFNECRQADGDNASVGSALAKRLSTFQQKFAEDLDFRRTYAIEAQTAYLYAQTAPLLSETGENLPTGNFIDPHGFLMEHSREEEAGIKGGSLLPQGRVVSLPTDVAEWVKGSLRENLKAYITSSAEQGNFFPDVPFSRVEGVLGILPGDAAYLAYDDIGRRVFYPTQQSIDRSLNGWDVEGLGGFSLPWERNRETVDMPNFYREDVTGFSETGLQKINLNNFTNSPTFERNAPSTFGDRIRSGWGAVVGTVSAFGRGLRNSLSSWF